MNTSNLNKATETLRKTLEHDKVNLDRITLEMNNIFVEVDKIFDELDINLDKFEKSLTAQRFRSTKWSTNHVGKTTTTTRSTSEGTTKRENLQPKTVWSFITRWWK